MQGKRGHKHSNNKYNIFARLTCATSRLCGLNAINGTQNKSMGWFFATALWIHSLLNLCLRIKMEMLLGVV